MIVTREEEGKEVIRVDTCDDIIMAQVGLECKEFWLTFVCCLCIGGLYGLGLIVAHCGYEGER